MEGEVDLHPQLSPERRREHFLAGIRLFAAGEHFAAHEEWETVWRSTTPEPRDLFQGLVQLAAGMHHWHRRQRPEVAARVLAKGRRRLTDLPSPCQGVDLATLCDDVADWETWLRGRRNAPPPPPLRIPVADPGAVA